MLPQFGSRISRLLAGFISITTFTLTLTLAATSSAQVAPSERLCDNSFEDCRATILQMIRNETAGIDVSFWFMTDWRYSSEIIKRWQAGVPVRVLLDCAPTRTIPLACRSGSRSSTPGFRSGTRRRPASITGR